MATDREKLFHLRIVAMATCATLDRAHACGVPGAAEMRDALRAAIHYQGEDTDETDEENLKGETC